MAFHLGFGTVTMRLLYFLIGFLLQTVWSNGQVTTIEVAPNLTAPSLSEDDDVHVINLEGTSNGRLFLFLGGTDSQTDQYLALRRYAARMGFAVINLSYPNEIATASLRDERDTLVFTKYREEICFGTSASDFVQVDSLNSIFTRFKLLLHYLAMNNSDHPWANYLLASGEVIWDKIVVAGHSQGSGHAAFLGKRFILDRVLMFSGPNDFSDRYDRPALWLSESPGDAHGYALWLFKHLR